MSMPFPRPQGRTFDGLADAASALVNAAGERRGERGSAASLLGRWATVTGAAICERGDLADADEPELQGQPSTRQQRFDESDAGLGAGHAAYGRNGTFWSDASWIECHDGKARRAKPEISMLVDGMVGRIGLWRLAGNSIVPQLAAEVLAAILDAEVSLTSGQGT